MHPLIAAFQNSLRGFAVALRSERAVRQEAVLLALAVPLALALSADLWVRVALVGTVVAALAVEMLNTAIERLCDHVTPQIHPAIGAIKDMGSSAVLCTLILMGLVWGAALLERLGF